MPEALPPEVLKRLTACLPADALLTSVEEMTPYECDGFSPYRRLPRAVVLPHNEQQVQAVLRICHAAGIAVVARGAGTGLSGGALPVETGIVLSLARLNRIVWRLIPLTVPPGYNRVYAIWPFPLQHSLTACTTRRIRPHNWPAPLAAMWRKIQAGCIASNTA